MFGSLMQISIGERQIEVFVGFVGDAGHECLGRFLPANISNRTCVEMRNRIRMVWGKLGKRAQVLIISRESRTIDILIAKNGIDPPCPKRTVVH